MGKQYWSIWLAITDDNPTHDVSNLADLKCPIQLLAGEALIRLTHGAFSHQLIMLTTYRLFVTYSKSFVNIPLRMVESVDIHEATGISAICKDGTVQR